MTSMSYHIIQKTKKCGYLSMHCSKQFLRVLGNLRQNFWILSDLRQTLLANSSKRWQYPQHCIDRSTEVRLHRNLWDAISYASPNPRLNPSVNHALEDIETREWIKATNQYICIHVWMWIIVPLEVSMAPSYSNTASITMTSQWTR